ncbi:hypothetical protein F4556_001700 [Kitasatospora gansuensis]|uniref:Secreted protein n=1 Tax=Kitasatospora gansuensis TaxID=258050 RepID=A0A7W7S945_9ACTN|nr:hypothetical protein [Kitasatospora gansuensis]MBB4946165.1 hypothetical protein [Kitasatospora gansuensis]
MNRMITGAVLALAALTAATGPGHAASNNTIGDVAQAPGGWSLTTSAVCSPEVAAVPLVGDVVADHSTTCAEARPTS